jgi:hypothetical protein
MEWCKGIHRHLLQCENNSNIVFFFLIEYRCHCLLYGLLLLSLSSAPPRLTLDSSGILRNPMTEEKSPVLDGRHIIIDRPRTLNALVAIIIIVVHARFGGRKCRDLSTMGVLSLSSHHLVATHFHSFVLDEPPMTFLKIAVARRPIRTFDIQPRTIPEKDRKVVTTPHPYCKAIASPPSPPQSPQ